MHTKSRSRIDFANATPGFPIRLGNVFGQEVNAADIQTDRLDRALGHRPIVGMDHIRHIDRRTASRQVCRRTKKNDFALFWHGIAIVAEPRQQPVCLVIELQTRKNFFVTHAASRVGINNVDQLRNRAFSVAHHVTRHTFRGRDQFAVDHQQSMIEPLDIPFNNYVAAMFPGLVEANLDLLGCLQVNRHTAPVVSGQWFQHDRISDPFCRPLRVTAIAHHFLHGYG